MSKKEPKETYNCVKCPSFCCSSYDYVDLTHNDMALIATKLDISLEKFKKKYTTKSDSGEAELMLRKVKDKMLNQTCIFLDKKSRLCGIHEFRPDVCRDWNGVVKGKGKDKRRVCNFYDFWQFIKEDQGKDYKPLIQISRREWKKKDVPDL